jgi:hypothetical protein
MKKGSKGWLIRVKHNYILNWLRIRWQNSKSTSRRLRALIQNHIIEWYHLLLISIRYAWMMTMEWQAAIIIMCHLLLYWIYRNKQCHHSIMHTNYLTHQIPNHNRWVTNNKIGRFLRTSQSPVRSQKWQFH